MKILDFVTTQIRSLSSGMFHPSSAGIAREFHRIHPDDHTRIVAIKPNGVEVPLQGFNQLKLLPDLVPTCVATHRLENPDFLIGVVTLATGEVDWS